MHILTSHRPPRGLLRCSGIILALLTTTSLAGPGVMDSALTTRFQEMLDARAKSLNCGMILAVRMAGRGEWVGATGYAQRGHEVLTNAAAEPLLDSWGLPSRQGAQRMRPDDLMFVDSCSKTYLAALLMRLVADNALSLEDIRRMEPQRPSTAITPGHSGPDIS